MNDAKTTSRVLKCVVMLGIGCGVSVLAFCFWRFGCHEVENAQSRKSLSDSDVNVGQTSRQDVARSRRSAGQSHLPRRPLASVAPAKRISIGTVATVSAGVPEMEGKSLSEKIPAERSASERAQMASDKNQLMDELLNQPDIPADYGMQMVALFRDREQDVVTRDFAVQHIGLYAAALNRRGVYRVDSVEVRTLRAALDEAAAESYQESQETFSKLFEDQEKYVAIMTAIGEMLFAERKNDRLDGNLIKAFVWSRSISMICAFSVPMITSSSYSS